MSIQVSRSELTRTVVAIDPAATANEDSDDTGIVVVARGPHQPSTCDIPFCPGHGYVLADRTCHELPHVWANRAVEVYDEWQADRIIAETNNGGDMVGSLIHAVRAGVPYSKVTATRGKRVRAEPVAALNEQGRFHFVGSDLGELEMQLTSWNPESNQDSPDRLDALVWGAVALGLIGGQGAAFMAAFQEEIANRKPSEPAQLKSLPHHVNLIDHPVAQPKCKNGAAHRFQREQNGALCAVCGCWLQED